MGFSMVVRTVIAGAAVAAAVIGMSPAAFASDGMSVQLNVDAAGQPSRVNTFQFTGVNTAYGACPGGHGVFSSPELLFGSVHQDSATQVHAEAMLRPAIVAGAYKKLTLTCGNESVTATFTVPER